MFSGGFTLATHEVFQFIYVFAPGESVKEFAAAELSFVEGALAVAGAKIKVIE